MILKDFVSFSVSVESTPPGSRISLNKQQCIDLTCDVEDDAIHIQSISLTSTGNFLVHMYT